MPCSALTVSWWRGQSRAVQPQTLPGSQEENYVLAWAAQNHCKSIYGTLNQISLGGDTTFHRVALSLSEGLPAVINRSVIYDTRAKWSHVLAFMGKSTAYPALCFRMQPSAQSQPWQLCWMTIIQNHMRLAVGVIELKLRSQFKCLCDLNHLTRQTDRQTDIELNIY